MGEATTTEPEDGEQLRRAAAGDAAAWGSLLIAHELRLTRMVAFRLDSRLHGRVDAADVVQEAFLAASASEHREGYFRAEPAIPLFLWLRGVVSNKLLEVHRHHLGTHMRDAAREVPLDRRGAGGAMHSPEQTSAALVAQLSASVTRPSVAAARGETKATIRTALDAMDDTDREVLALRHFEQLTNGEAAQVLGIQERAAAKRYIRALKRLKDLLAELPGGLTGLRP
jgi:RNA polymerase sigma-70 factor (ECF subfamily)